jgi:hypothetical protein
MILSSPLRAVGHAVLPPMLTKNPLQTVGYSIGAAAVSEDAFFYCTVMVIAGDVEPEYVVSPL